MSKQPLTVRVETSTRRRLDQIAASVDRDRTYVVNEALKAYVELYQWQVDHIRQGLKEADEGKFASDAEVKRVFAKLRRK